MLRLKISNLLLSGTFLFSPLSAAQDDAVGSTAIKRDYSKGDYEVILYDAETIARVNAKPTDMALSAARSFNEAGVAVGNNSTTETPSKLKSGKSSSLSDPEPKPDTPKYPRDISDQFVEIIAGVPIIENPKSCDRGELDIDVTVKNVNSSEGTIVADLHDDIKENFLVWDKVVLRVRKSASEGDTKFCMPLKKPGDYAIAIYHDKNGNKEFDKNFLGIPKEHFGMSGDPKFGMKSPEYEEAVFTVPNKGADVEITLYSAGDILGGRKK